ncbi:MAG TPA: hypothetical protein VD999_06795 [Vitreimonas sp.]|nr:hypothetical protein [Vitreimonas sp.]
MSNFTITYLSERPSGFQRQKKGQHFIYLDESQQRIIDPVSLERIKSLVIPPAWQNVWISPDPRTHLQATGYDSKGRKQYRYHPEWSQHQQQHKFDKMVFFGEQLPNIRETVAGHLRDSGLSKQKVIAAIVALMETTLIRIGNEEYAQQNKSYGLTTLRDKHAKIKSTEIVFDFRGKSGVDHVITVDNPRLVKIVKASQEIPGYQLFQYLDENGQHHAIHSGDVNDYLQSLTNADITAKDFRTWGGTTLATEQFQACEPCEEEAQLKRNIVQTIKVVAERLGNRPATCRKYYVHPLVPESYLAGKLITALQEYLHDYPTQPRSAHHLKPIEFATLEFIRRQK